MKALSSRTTITTRRTCDKFTFYDGEDYIDKEITIITAPSWNIRPGTPVKGDPTWNQE